MTRHSKKQENITHDEEENQFLKKHDTCVSMADSCQCMTKATTI